MHELNDLCGKKHLPASPPLSRRLPFSKAADEEAFRGDQLIGQLIVRRQIPALKGCDQPRVEQLKAEAAMLRREVQAKANKQ